MPLYLEVADTDKVGRLYNILRKEMGDILTERMAIEDFRGLFSGATVTKEMFEECQLVNSIFADVATQITEREEQLRLEYNNAQALWEAVRKSEDKDQRKSAVIARNKAQAALWEYEQESKDQFSSLAMFMQYWAQGKDDNRRGWAQAMNTIVSNGHGSGAALFQTFAQEVVDAFAEQSGGESVPVRRPKIVKGSVRFDDQQRAFLVEVIENSDGENGEKRTFLFQYKGKKTLIFDDTSIPRTSEGS
jgi:hypothetical protein